MLKVVIPSREIENLEECVGAILKNDPNIQPSDIVVVDDDESGLISQFCAYSNLARVQGIKPFIFARNANLGLTEAFKTADHVILLNDDALLSTKRGFSMMEGEAIRNPQYGILSASTNVVGNVNQHPHGADNIRREFRTLCFVCVLIDRFTWQTVGPLDERYALDYGVEDGDYSYRARMAGRKLGIVDRCFVDHGSLRSSFRGKGHRSFQENKRLFREKWGFEYESR